MGHQAKIHMLGKKWKGGYSGPTRTVSKQACGECGAGLRCVSPAVLHEVASTDTTVPFWIWQGFSSGLHSKPGLIHFGVVAEMGDWL
jgi:hypothetical protein